MRKAIILIFLGVSVLVTSCKHQNQEIKPVLMPITSSVYSSITIEPDSMYAVYAATSGIVSNTYVEEGDLVKRGDIILSIQNQSRELDKENARLSLELAKANYQGTASILDELKAELETARLQMKNDSNLYVKQLALWENKIGTKNEFDKRKLAYEVARNSWITVKNKYTRTKNELRTQVLKAENTLRTNTRLNSNYLLTSYISGRVYEMLKNPGESVSGQEPVAYVGSRDQFIIKMSVDEVDIVKIRLGQQVLIVLDAYGKQVFGATVSQIAPNMDSRSQTFEVEALFDEQPEVLYAGLTGEANIIIYKKEKALTIPLAYLVGESNVQTKDGTLQVKTGIRSLDRVEILEGLSADDVLIEP